MWLRSSFRGGTSPKISPSCGLAWHVDAGGRLSQPPTVTTTIAVRSHSFKASARSPLTAREMGCLWTSQFDTSNTWASLPKSFAILKSTTGWRHLHLMADRHVVARLHLDAVAVDVVLAPRRRRRAREEARVDVRRQRVGRRRQRRGARSASCTASSATCRASSTATRSAVHWPACSIVALSRSNAPVAPSQLPATTMVFGPPVDATTLLCGSALQLRRRFALKM